jgi:hypothetical protein
MRSTFKIELKVDVDPGDAETMEAIKDAAREAAQVLYTQVLLLSAANVSPTGRARPKPQIAIMSDSVYIGTDEIALFAKDKESE